MKVHFRGYTRLFARHAGAAVSFWLAGILFGGVPNDYSLMPLRMCSFTTILQLFVAVCSEHLMKFLALSVLSGTVFTNRGNLDILDA